MTGGSKKEAGVVTAEIAYGCEVDSVVGDFLIESMWIIILVSSSHEQGTL